MTKALTNYWCIVVYTVYTVAPGCTWNWFLLLKHSHKWTTSQKTPKCHSAIETVRLLCLSRSWLVWSWTYQLTMTPNHGGRRTEKDPWQICRSHWLHSQHLLESSLLELGDGCVSSPTAVKFNVLVRKPSRLGATLHFYGQLEISWPVFLKK